MKFLVHLPGMKKRQLLAGPPVGASLGQCLEWSLKVGPCLQRKIEKRIGLRYRMCSAEAGIFRTMLVQSANELHAEEIPITAESLLLRLDLLISKRKGFG